MIFYDDDPRLISSTRFGQTLLLDTIPRNGAVKMNRVYENRDDGRLGGDLRYYFDRDINVPYNRFLFEPTSRIFESLPYVNPNGAVQGQFCRDANATCGCCLTDLADSQYFRNDIMTSLINKNNVNKFIFSTR